MVSVKKMRTFKFDIYPTDIFLLKKMQMFVKAYPVLKSQKLIFRPANRALKTLYIDS